jgi:hypothetical protein
MMTVLKNIVIHITFGFAIELVDEGESPGAKNRDKKEEGYASKPRFLRELWKKKIKIGAKGRPK